MRRVVYVAVSFLAGIIVFGGSAGAQTVEQLKAELAAKNAEIARLRSRVRQLETTSGAPVRAMAPPTYVPPPPPSPEEAAAEDRALEQALVSQGALVLPRGTYELTPEFSWAHWNCPQYPPQRAQANPFP
jgi:hypothetical protein